MRYYELDGQCYPSVTTILSIINKPNLNHWRGDKGNDEANRLLAEAGEIGTVVHSIAEKINRNEKWDHLVISNDVLLMGMAYQEWFIKTIETVVAVEQVVINKKYRYAGRVDLIATIIGDKLPSIIDIKTGGIWPDVYLQLVAYQEASPIETARRIVVPIDKKNPGNSIKIKEPNYTKKGEAFRMFLYALELYNYFNGDRGVRREDVVPINASELIGGDVGD